MPNPNWTHVEVRGTYHNIAGDPLRGRVAFYPRAALVVDQTGLVTMTSRAFVAELDVTGSFAIELPATDDPDIVPVNFTYHVKEFIRGGRSFDMSAPSSAAATGINITSIAPVPSDPGTIPPRTEIDVIGSELESLTLLAGHELPPASEYPNTIFFVIPQ